MSPLYPYNLLRYINWGTKVTDLTEQIVHKDFLSWEDALWALREVLEIPHGAIVLVPSFWCVDVMNNMRDHGLYAIAYPVDRSFQTDPEIFATYLRTHNPTMVVIFHAVGIRNKLMDVYEQWAYALTETCVLIEDYAHKIADPRTLRFVHTRHFVIESWRKVMPLQGASLYADASERHKLVPISSGVQRSDTWYIIGYWILMQWCLHVESWRVPYISRQCGAWAYMCMRKGYDKIGDSQEPLALPLLFSRIRRRIRTHTILSVRQLQVSLYEKLIGHQIRSDARFFPIEWTDEDRAQLRAYPVGIVHEHTTQVVTALHKNGLFVQVELADSDWSQKHTVIFLPIGLHMKTRDIQHVADIFLASTR